MPNELPPIGETATDYDERALLQDLEPEAGRLFDRHAKVAQEWFPHDYIPYRLGRDFDKEPDARPAAADRRRPDLLRGQPPDRGQPAVLSPPDPRDVRGGR